MSKYRIRLGDKSYDVELDELRGNTIAFHVDGEKYETSIERIFEPKATSRSAVTAAPAAPQKSSPTSHTPGQVISPMPGIIISLGVKEGEKIDAGHVVAVIEAMKMENNITASSNGVVKEIRVATGQEVRGGEVLVVIE